MKKTVYSAAILAGGLATRLRPMSEKIPKSLVLINNRPFIFYQLELLRQWQISRVVLCVGYLGDMIRNTVGNGSDFGLTIEYCFDGPDLRGTAGALKHALPLLSENFVVLYGDSYLPCDFSRILAFYQQIGQPSLMTVYKNANQWGKSNVEFGDGQIIAYNKAKPTPKMHYIDYGLNIFNQQVFHSISEHQPADLSELHQRLIQQRLLAGIEVDQRFYEVGSFEGIQELNEYFYHQQEVR
jgi:N-acetyl-alpha-D-muramate 1-phosphate uridylyltransferase